MFNLFPKKPKVKLGKNSQMAAEDKKRQSPLAGLAGTWKKLNSMDRKQAYTFGAIGVVALIGLLLLGSAVGSKDEDFADFETRGYDLANMPFSSDEAEQYLLASKYPDMQGSGAVGLYSEEEKAERQAEDMENEDEDYSSGGYSSGSAAGGYYGGSGSRGGGRGGSTAIGRLNNASIQKAGGSGMSGSFGPSGDFSNFRNQNKGNDKFQGRGSGNARTALRQTAMGSRAAAGLKDNKLANAKKAMMGGNIEGSKAFMDDSGAVNLAEAKGLNLDPNAPVSSADMSGLDDALQNANKEAAKKEQQEEEKKWWQEMLEQAVQTLVNGLVNFGLDSMQDGIRAAQAGRRQQQADYAAYKEEAGADAAMKFKEWKKTDAGKNSFNEGQSGYYDHYGYSSNYSSNRSGKKDIETITVGGKTYRGRFSPDGKSFTPTGQTSSVAVTYDKSGTITHIGN